MLPLVLVDPLDLHVEQRVRIDDDARATADQLGQVALVLALDVAPRVEERGIVRRGLERAELVLVGNPVLADA